MGRPKQEKLLPTFDPVVTEHIRRLRPAGTKVGPKSIYADLCQIKSLASYDLPKPSTIAYFLNQSGLVSTYEKHTALPNTQLQKAQRAHHVWQADGMGALDAPGVGRINFLNIKDLFSGVYCNSLVVLSNSHNGSPSADQYRNCLRRAFAIYGLPEKIQVDHGSAFYENKGKSPFPTRFHLWLISLGIELLFSRKYRPTDQGVVERMHQTIKNQVLRTDPYASLFTIQQKTDERVERLNYHIPSSSFNNLPPLVANPQARHSGRFYCPKNEKELIDFELVFDYLSQGKWIRQATGSRGNLISLGGIKYHLLDTDKWQKVELTFEKGTKMIKPCMFKTRRELNPILIKDITYQYLQGDDFLDCLPEGFQFQLPFPNAPYKRGTTFLELGGV
jgi:transposase InsO family protein